jgi:hypothetical protein
LGRVLLHEYCHSSSSEGRHDHTPEFYRLFHDCSDSIPPFAERALHVYRQHLTKASRELERERLAGEHQAILEKKAFGALSGEPPAAAAMAPLAAVVTRLGPRPAGLRVSLAQLALSFQ